MKIWGENVPYVNERTIAEGASVFDVNLSGKKTLIGRSSGKNLLKAEHPWGHFYKPCASTFLAHSILNKTKLSGTQDRDMLLTGMFLSFFVCLNFKN